MSITQTVARFFCGCLYLNPIDTALMCPKHRDTPERAYITGRERITAPDNNISHIPALARNRVIPQIPEVLSNNSRNSIQNVSYVIDGQREQWSTPEPDAIGLCAACYIDFDDIYETRVSMCECPDEQCSYRWCGSLNGLHAFWKLHAQSKSQEATGIRESDIFREGQFIELPEEARNILDKERATLQAQADRLIPELHQARQAFAHRRSPRPPSVYLSPFLDSMYNSMYKTTTSQLSRHKPQRNLIATTLRNDLLRLYIMGAIPPFQNEDTMNHIPPKLKARFQMIAELQEDWNSYGASPISPWSISQARSIINKGMAMGLPAPAVAPATGASVSIEWQTGNAGLIIDVDPQQGLTYLIADKAGGTETEGELNESNLSHILQKATDPPKTGAPTPANIPSQH